jgi:hypothetical protein
MPSPIPSATVSSAIDMRQREGLRVVICAIVSCSASSPTCHSISGLIRLSSFPATAAQGPCKRSVERLHRLAAVPALAAAVRGGQRGSRPAPGLVTRRQIPQWRAGAPAGVSFGYSFLRRRLRRCALDIRTHFCKRRVVRQRDRDLQPLNPNRTWLEGIVPDGGCYARLASTRGWG